MATGPSEWPMSWRIIILLNVSFYNMMGNVFAAGVPPLFSLLIEDLHCSTNQAAHLTTYALLMLGLANLWAVPIVEYLGKRYTILISMTVFLIANIWAATSQTYSSLLGTRFLGGISGGVIEALGPIIVSECFLEKQLASAMVVYVGFLAAGSAIGPIVAGGIASGLHNWRWFFIISSIAIGVNLVTSILMLPSTEYAGDNGYPANDEVQETKVMGTPRDTQCEIELTENEPESPKKISNLYSIPPKLWLPWQIGFLNFGALVGLLIGLPVGGVVADLLSRRAMKSNGQHDPRSRLPLVLLGALLSPTGCVIIGVSLQKNLNWAGTSVGWGLLSFGLTASANILLTYAVDCHLHRAMDIGVLVNVIKNTIGFGVSYAAINWYDKSGGEAQYGAMAGILWATYLLVIPLYFFRDSLKKFSARWFTDDGA
ncbi:MFS transporter [Talaromyces pinophilus]|uniref:MFS transporter n=1 Tax=Talaromyces pinophilus TaxID=128442 RepID=A0A6V8HAL1_TALPI|nr:MFS transporter [Talaromyces pinophilus]